MVEAVIGCVVVVAIVCVTIARSVWSGVDDVANVKINMEVDDDGLRTSNSRR